MRCVSCGHPESKVIDSRPSEDGLSIRRRRECLECGTRFTTYERHNESPLIVIKNDRSSESFDRTKLLRGLLIATAKRDVPANKLEALIDDVEAEIRNTLKNEVHSRALGEMVLKRLRAIDDVAYIRFASVYKDFKDIDEFQSALKDMN
ncbi:MAG: transcriptional regulator NrdR [Coriobacteriales bacterium]|jgi:transcriptional repressor NrdR|nr:transcriptional regulator NrdR [Coriobacteriales bacterium]